MTGSSTLPASRSDDEPGFLMDQLDGNMSLNSSICSNLNESVSLSELKINHQIPTHSGFRPHKIIIERPPHCRKTIRRDNKIVHALALPRISNYNMRALFSKTENLTRDMDERESDLVFLTEVLEKQENKKHQFKLEEMLEMHGIKYISTPRPGAQRGGGAALAVRLEKFTITKLNIALPKSVEVVWGLLKPKTVSGKFSTIIVCCFYSPPRSRKNSVLIDHITTTLQSLLNIHNNPGVIISGDRNGIDIPSLLSIDPSLRQTVRLPTRGVKILDVIVSNLASYFNEPIIIPPILPDRPGHGAPSDHSGVFAAPKTNQHQLSLRTKVRKKVRPMPESLLPTFEAKLLSQNFDILNGMSVQLMVETFQSITLNILHETFPERDICVSPEDSPWFNEHLRHLKRKRQRWYQRHGKDERYEQLQNHFDEKLKVEMIKYREKINIEVKEGKRGSSYAALKRMRMRPGDETQTGFQLPAHAELDLNSAQSAELIAEHFSCISQEYAPLDTRNLPPNVQTFLLNDQSFAPTLSTHEVLLRINKAKKPNGMVPGDLPKKLVKLFAATLAPTITAIFNNISRSADYPRMWKIEHQIAIPKSYPPQNEDDLRNLAKTPFWSKIYESFIGGWLLPKIKPYLDPGQCGLKGFSITHYLIKLLHFAHSTLDLNKPHAVLAACVDLSKAFNRVDHCLVIQDLYDMHTPACLLKIVISYLSDRSMVLTYNNEQSTMKMLPGGGPQGAYLGGLIFIIKYNGAFLRPPIPRLMQSPATKSRSESVKFVDDGTVAVSIDLKTCLVTDPVNRPHPRNYHERTGHILPAENNLLQYYIEDTEQFVKENKMVLNKKKTKVISFTKSRKWDFPPEVHFSNGTQIECIPETKLVGVILSSDLRWFKNTQYICQKAREKIWILRRMVKMDLDLETMFDVYTKEVRSVLELAVPVWHSGITKQQAADIERIKKISFKILLGEGYRSYKASCALFSTQTLEERRIKLCRKFASKNFKSDNCLFTRVGSNANTRQKSDLVKEYKANTVRFQKSSLPFLAKLLNSSQK